MEGVIQSVINFSEGRNREVIEKIVDEIRHTPGAKLLDYTCDYDHNRSVVTFIGPPGAVAEGAYRLTARAAALINMEKHRGGHPRMGATDVIPFIPVFRATMEDCVALARDTGRRIGEELLIPVFLYGEAAASPARKNLADLRKGEYEGLKESIKTPDRAPDFGPAAMHPSAGAVGVGARKPLVAYNINLHTGDLDVARNIAGAIREKGGGLKNVRAIGLKLEERNRVQVSMNLVDCENTPIHHVFELVKAEAARYGVNVAESEIVGLSPQQYLLEAACYYLQLNNFSERQIIENRVFFEAGD